MNAVVADTAPAPPESRAIAVIPRNPMEVLALMIQRGAEMTVVEKMMDLQDRWEAKQARRAFDAAISEAKAKIKPIIRNREVDFTSQKGRTNYRHEDFAAIAAHVDPILAEHGLSYRHRPHQDGKMLTITCILSHRDGHSEESSLSAMNDESGNKNGIQGIGSTSSYLQRYTLKLALGLAVAHDDDGRGGSQDEDFISEKQAADLQALIDEVKADKAAFLRFCKVESLEDLPANKYAQAVQALRDKGRGAR